MNQEAMHWVKTRIKPMLAPIIRFSTSHCARVLMYHRFSSYHARSGLNIERLEEQVRFMRHHFKILPLRSIVERLQAGIPPEPYSMAVTIDDGYADFGELAYPVFRRHGIPVTLYVVSEFASGQTWLWWDAIRYLLMNARNGDYHIRVADRLIAVSLVDTVSREAAWHTLADTGLALTPDERDQYIQDLQASFSVLLPNSPSREFAALDWTQLQTLDPELVEIGAHTRTHPILSRCSTERIIEEIAGSKKAIEEQLRREVRTFCYPNGQWSDVDERCFAAVQKAGYDSAVMACGTMVRKDANLYALERIVVPGERQEFISSISGLPHLRQRVADKFTHLIANQQPKWAA